MSYNPIKQEGKKSTKHSIKEDIRMASMSMRRCSTSLVVQYKNKETRL